MKRCGDEDDEMKRTGRCGDGIESSEMGARIGERRTNEISRWVLHL